MTSSSNTRQAPIDSLAGITRSLDLDPVLARIDQLPRHSHGSASSHPKAAPSDGLVHLLSRTTFGFAAAELELASNLGHAGWVDWQLDHQGIDDSFLEDILLEFFPTLSMDYRDILGALDDGEDINPAGELIAATVLRQLYSPRQLFEVMVEFWTNHFNVFLLDGPVQYLKTGDDRDNIRPHALGRFRDLLHANARSPAMLVYLDNVSNTLDGPNENYARELMELHTLGVDGGYTEGDVKDVARAFTGWTLDPRRDGLFVFNPGDHDFESKSVLGQILPSGQGVEDGEQVLDLLASHPSTARFIASKLVQRFVSDSPRDDLVERVAETFSATDGDITAVMRTLLNDADFKSAQGLKFKRPAEFLGSVFRSLAPIPNGNYIRVLFRELESQGQVPYFAQPPTGYDDDEQSWLSSNALLSRWNFGLAVAHGEVAVSRQRGGEDDQSDLDPGRVMADYLNLPMLAMLGEARTPAAIVDRMIDAVLHRAISVQDRNTLVAYAADGRPSSVPLSLPLAVEAGRGVVGALIASRYFQAR